MSIPDFQTLMLPVLKLSKLGEIKVADAVKRIADEFTLKDQEREKLLKSGRKTVIADRVHWAKTYLLKAGLVKSLRYGYFMITSEGEVVLSDPPKKIDKAFLSKFDDYNKWIKRSNKDRLAEVESTEDLIVGTPEERVEAAFEDLNANLREELLERILEMDPTKFEKLIVDLMLGMDYGANGSGKQVGCTGDGGVDGIINEDVLGLDTIYLQAKRYAIDNSIGVNKIREFAGALEERGATKGVFVTTSHFTKTAIKSAEDIKRSLILINGEELTRLLVKYGVAVRGYHTLELKKVDMDYFNEADD